MRFGFAQAALYEAMWYRNIVVKSRQVWITTLAQAFALDQAMWTKNYKAGIIAHTLDSAEEIFNTKIKYMYDNLPPEIRARNPAHVSTKRKLELSNGSFIYVTTSLRSGTYNFLHVSEMAKICLQGKNKADELITGSIEAVPETGIVILEGTPEGPDLEFAEIYNESVEREEAGVPLTNLDFKPFFFPGYKHPENRLTTPVQLPKKAKEYFDALEVSEDVKLDPKFTWWYTVKERTLKGKMKQEHPNTAEEAFSKITEGAIFGEQMTEAEAAGRICDLPIIRGVPIHVTFDLGHNDTTSLFFFQQAGAWINFIRSYEHRLVDITHYIELLKELEREENYLYGTLYLPHDGKAHHIDSVAGSVDEILRKHGFRTRVVNRPTKKLVTIEKARRLIPQSRFDRELCKEGITALRNYAWTYDEVYGVFRKVPRHDRFSNYADAYQTYAHEYRDRGPGRFGPSDDGPPPWSREAQLKNEKRRRGRAWLV